MCIQECGNGDVCSISYVGFNMLYLPTLLFSTELNPNKQKIRKIEGNLYFRGSGEKGKI